MTSVSAREFLRSHILGLVAIFIAFTGTAVAAQQSGTSDGPKASASVVTDAKFKKLKRRVAALEKRTDQVGQVPTSLPPNGPAGGVLTGTYPNPGLGADTVGSAQIAAFAVGTDDLAINAVDTQRIADGQVGSADIAATAVGSGQLQPSSVGSFALRNVIAAVGSGVTVNSGTPQTTQVTCPPGGQLIAGGYAWQDDEANSIIANAPSETDPNGTWLVRGMVNAGSNNLFAWATCMP